MRDAAVRQVLWKLLWAKHSGETSALLLDELGLGHVREAEAEALVEVAMLAVASSPGFRGGA
jgi:hypothetical protein